MVRLGGLNRLDVRINRRILFPTVSSRVLPYLKHEFAVDLFGGKRLFERR